MRMTITEQQIIDSWSKWGDGSELKPGFAKWLAEELSRPVEYPHSPMPPIHDFPAFHTYWAWRWRIR